MILPPSPTSHIRTLFAGIGLVLLSLVLGGSYFFVFRIKTLPPPESVVPPVAQIIKKVFGTSVQGKPIEGYEIGAGADVILLHGAIHGNEMGSGWLMKELVLEIALNPHLVASNKKLVIIPIVNPDGYYDRTDLLNAREVNLNLNFGTRDWQKYGPEGTFAGKEPFSEPESQVLKKVIEEYRPNLMITFHSHGKLVSPEASELSKAWSKWYAHKTGYTYFDEWDYPGTATKWFEEATGKPGLTVELTQDLQSDWDINRSALLELIGFSGIGVP